MESLTSRRRRGANALLYARFKVPNIIASFLCQCRFLGMCFSTCMCVCTYVSIRMCIWICISIRYMYMHVYMYVPMQVHMYM